jgi:translation initiation factor 3 subunit E
MRYLTELKIPPQSIEVLYQRAKFVFDCGKYTKAAELLGNYRALTTDSEKGFSALWGKLVCEIVSFEWDQALETVNLLRDAIDQKVRKFI